MCPYCISAHLVCNCVVLIRPGSAGSLLDSVWKLCTSCKWLWGTTAAAPPPFRPGNPALCGSCPLVTPYYCRLGDLLCLFVYHLFVYYFVCVCICVICVFFVFFWVVFRCSFLLQYFNTVGWVFWPVKTVGRITYIVLVQILNHAQSICNWHFIPFNTGCDCTAQCQLSRGSALPDVKSGGEVRRGVYPSTF